MKVEKGYKQTEVGIIPEDWDLIPYGKAFDFLNTATYSRSQLSDTGEVEYVHYGDIHTRWKHFLDFEKNGLPKISNDKVKDYSLIKNGDVIMADASEDMEGVGTSIEIKNIEDKKAISGLHTFLLRDKGVFVDGFRGYIHLNKIVKNQLGKLATGMKVFSVSKTNLKTVLIPLPSTEKEQTEIVSALSQTDELISSLKKLIEKKQNIKQATVQVLLTGKKRLKGFNDNWEKDSVGELTKFHKQGYYTKETYKDNGKYFLLRGTDMQNPEIDLSTTPTINASDADFKSYKVEKGDFLIVRSGAIGRYGIATNLPDSIFGSYLINFRFKKDKILNSFFGYFYESETATKQLKVITQGGGNININAENIKSLLISLPAIPEQIGITEVLAEIDNEIKSLQEQLSKYNLVKQGMVQNLLTGKVRLVNQR